MVDEYRDKATRNLLRKAAKDRNISPEFLSLYRQEERLIEELQKARRSETALFANIFDPSVSAQSLAELAPESALPTLSASINIPYETVDIDDLVGRGLISERIAEQFKRLPDIEGGSSFQLSELEDQIRIIAPGKGSRWGESIPVMASFPTLGESAGGYETVRFAKDYLGERSVSSMISRKTMMAIPSKEGTKFRAMAYGDALAESINKALRGEHQFLFGQTIQGIKPGARRIDITSTLSDIGQALRGGLVFMGGERAKAARRPIGFTNYLRSQQIHVPQLQEVLDVGNIQGGQFYDFRSRDVYKYEGETISERAIDALKRAEKYKRESIKDLVESGYEPAVQLADRFGIEKAYHQFGALRETELLKGYMTAGPGLEMYSPFGELMLPQKLAVQRFAVAPMIGERVREHQIDVARESMSESMRMFVRSGTTEEFDRIEGISATAMDIPTIDDVNMHRIKGMKPTLPMPTHTPTFLRKRSAIILDPSVTMALDLGENALLVSERFGRTLATRHGGRIYEAGMGTPVLFGGVKANINQLFEDINKFGGYDVLSGYGMLKRPEAMRETLLGIYESEMLAAGKGQKDIARMRKEIFGLETKRAAIFGGTEELYHGVRDPAVSPTGLSANLAGVLEEAEVKGLPVSNIKEISDTERLRTLQKYEEKLKGFGIEDPYNLSARTKTINIMGHDVRVLEAMTEIARRPEIGEKIWQTTPIDLSEGYEGIFGGRSGMKIREEEIMSAGFAGNVKMESLLKKLQKSHGGRKNVSELLRFYGALDSRVDKKIQTLSAKEFVNRFKASAEVIREQSARISDPGFLGQELVDLPLFKQLQHEGMYVELPSAIKVNTSGVDNIIQRAYLPSFSALGMGIKGGERQKGFALAKYRAFTEQLSDILEGRMSGQSTRQLAGTIEDIGGYLSKIATGKQGILASAAAPRVRGSGYLGVQTRASKFSQSELTELFGEFVPKQDAAGMASAYKDFQNLAPPPSAHNVFGIKKDSWTTKTMERFRGLEESIIELNPKTMRGILGDVGYTRFKKQGGYAFGLATAYPMVTPEAQLGAIFVENKNIQEGVISTSRALRDVGHRDYDMDKLRALINMDKAFQEAGAERLGLEVEEFGEGYLRAVGFTPASTTGSYKTSEILKAQRMKSGRNMIKELFETDLFRKMALGEDISAENMAAYLGDLDKKALRTVEQKYSTVERKLLTGITDKIAKPRMHNAFDIIRVMGGEGSGSIQSRLANSVRIMGQGIQQTIQKGEASKGMMDLIGQWNLTQAGMTRLGTGNRKEMFRRLSKSQWQDIKAALGPDIIQQMSFKGTPTLGSIEKFLERRNVKAEQLSAYKEIHRKLTAGSDAEVMRNKNIADVSEMIMEQLGGGEQYFHYAPHVKEQMRQSIMDAIDADTGFVDYFVPGQPGKAVADLRHAATKFAEETGVSRDIAEKQIKEYTAEQFMKVQPAMEAFHVAKERMIPDQIKDIRKLTGSIYDPKDLEKMFSIIDDIKLTEKSNSIVAQVAEYQAKSKAGDIGLQQVVKGFERLSEANTYTKTAAKEFTKTGSKIQKNLGKWTRSIGGTAIRVAAIGGMITAPVIMSKLLGRSDKLEPEPGDIPDGMNNTQRPAAPTNAAERIPAHPEPERVNTATIKAPHMVTAMHNKIKHETDFADNRQIEMAHSLAQGFSGNTMVNIRDNREMHTDLSIRRDVSNRNNSLFGGY